MKVDQVVILATFMSLSTLATNVLTRAAPNVISVEIHRRDPSDLFKYERNRLRKRQNTLELTLDNEETLYFANVSLGTPAQTFELHIDTGSSDLWVNTANSTLCSRRDQCDGGTFSPDSSSTFNVVNNEFNISYVDGSGAYGDYATDTLVIGDVTLDNFQFGLGEVSTSTEGILGIGYAANEVQVQRGGLDSYPNLPQALKNAGRISRNAYSLWLNDQESNSGTILFGGVNTAKYQDGLATIPILEVYGTYSELIIAFTGVSLSGSDLSSSNLPVAGLLDSGTTLTYLPYDITSTIYQKIGVTYDEQAGYGYVDCNLAQQSGTVEYTFSGKTISVAYEELVINDDSSGGGRGQSSQSCIFGIAPTSGAAVFGDTFLRSAYVVYDLDNNQISLAQTVFNATDDTVEEIPSGTSLPPGATAVSNPVTAVNGGSTGSDSAFSSQAGTTSNGNSVGRSLLATAGTAMLAICMFTI